GCAAACAADSTIVACNLNADEGPRSERWLSASKANGLLEDEEAVRLSLVYVLIERVKAIDCAARSARSLAASTPAGLLPCRREPAPVGRQRPRRTGDTSRWRRPRRWLRR